MKHLHLNILLTVTFQCCASIAGIAQQEAAVALRAPGDAADSA
jgi:hypothetical protein